jgi:hypothetical protein
MAGVQALDAPSQCSFQTLVLQSAALHREHPCTHLVGGSGLNHCWVLLPNLRRLAGLIGWL